VVGEGEAVGSVRVADDGEVAFVVLAVVLGAEADEVPGDGLTAVLPVDDVVHMDPEALVAAGDAAPSITVLDEATDAAGDDADGASEVDRGAVGPAGDLHVSVAGEEAAQLVGQQVAEVERRCPTGSLIAAVTTEVRPDLAPVIGWRVTVSCGTGGIR